MFYGKSKSKIKNLLYSTAFLLCFMVFNIVDSNLKNNYSHKAETIQENGFRIFWWHGFLDGIKGNTEVGLFGFCIIGCK